MSQVMVFQRSVCVTPNKCEFALGDSYLRAQISQCIVRTHHASFSILLFFSFSDQNAGFCFHMADFKTRHTNFKTRHIDRVSGFGPCYVVVKCIEAFYCMIFDRTSAQTCIIDLIKSLSLQVDRSIIGNIALQTDLAMLFMAQSGASKKMKM